MKLLELNPQFIRHEERNEHRYLIKVDSLKDAHGIRFLCPKCFTENKGPVGTHTVICWFEGLVDDDVAPAPGRWTPAGSSYDDLTFVPGANIKAVSVLLLGGCAWHGHLTNGEVTTC